MWMKSSFRFFLLSLFIYVVVGQDQISEGDPVEARAPDDESLSRLYTEDIPTALKQEIEDIKKNGEVSNEVCVDGKYCFTQIAISYCPDDRDCACPSTWKYYSPNSITLDGILWYPFAYQWARVGECLNPDRICHINYWPLEYHRCRQLYQYRGFFYYTHDPYFRVKQLYVILPDYCSCSCRFPWCPLLRSSVAAAE